MGMTRARHVIIRVSKYQRVKSVFKKSQRSRIEVRKCIVKVQEVSRNVRSEARRCKREVKKSSQIREEYREGSYEEFRDLRPRNVSEIKSIVVPH